MENKYYTLQEVADYFKLSIATIRTWRLEGKLKVVKIGSAVRVTEEEVKRLEKGE